MACKNATALRVGTDNIPRMGCVDLYIPTTSLLYSARMQREVYICGWIVLIEIQLRFVIRPPSMFNKPSTLPHKKIHETGRC